MDLGRFSQPHSRLGEQQSHMSQGSGLIGWEAPSRQAESPWSEQEEQPGRRPSFIGLHRAPAKFGGRPMGERGAWCSDCSDGRKRGSRPALLALAPPWPGLRGVVAATANSPRNHASICLAFRGAAPQHLDRQHGFRSGLHSHPRSDCSVIDAATSLPTWHGSRQGAEVYRKKSDMTFVIISDTVSRWMHEKAEWALGFAL
ncbi:hypothetical protein BDU57DRAFT_532980 [Ampelomyces quisqualis]|uniref:Uncharacterized protein n=1 Tax=Ampelomyces quisqualis TaxID=50730 RepID=A0A6A5Q9G9_AMPQU|nr:hypothetical protein BDU57DRAFT_532980 [Ampelomyces quisqualis]